ncbi:hypothetical protein V1283_006690 [Bradyrhizobium sp. AZCC 2262]
MRDLGLSRFDFDETLACLPLKARLFSQRHLIEKGGLRSDDNFPALSPAWPRQRPANAFAGLTRDFSVNLFLVCPRGNAASSV